MDQLAKLEVIMMSISFGGSIYYARDRPEESVWEQLHPSQQADREHHIQEGSILYRPDVWLLELEEVI
jgi:hypothetical protein